MLINKLLILKNVQPFFVKILFMVLHKNCPYIIYYDKQCMINIKNCPALFFTNFKKKNGKTFFKNKNVQKIKKNIVRFFSIGFYESYH